MSEKITQILEEIAAQICDEYCKYPSQIASQEELDRICESCPLERI